MSTELKLFASDNLTFKDRFYLLMNILISNQTNSRLDSMLFLGIFFLQIITGFFSEQVGVFDTKKSKSDKILNYLYQILRLKELFVGSYSTYKYCIYIILGVVVVFTLYFIYVITKTSKLSFYTTSEELLNFYTKTYIYIGFNIILDLTISNRLENIGLVPWVGKTPSRYIISFILFLVVNIRGKINILMIISFLGYKLICFVKKRKYLENKFFLERYLYDLDYDKIIYERDKNIKKLRIGKYHYFNYLGEKKVLQEIFGVMDKN